MSPADTKKRLQFSSVLGVTTIVTLTAAKINLNGRQFCPLPLKIDEANDFCWPMQQEGMTSDHQRYQRQKVA